MLSFYRTKEYFQMASAHESVTLPHGVALGMSFCVSHQLKAYNVEILQFTRGISLEGRAVASLHYDLLPSLRVGAVLTHINAVSLRDASYTTAIRLIQNRSSHQPLTLKFIHPNTTDSSAALIATLGNGPLGVSLTRSSHETFACMLMYVSPLEFGGEISLWNRLHPKHQLAEGMLLTSVNGTDLSRLSFHESLSLLKAAKRFPSVQLGATPCPEASYVRVSLQGVEGPTLLPSDVVVAFTPRHLGLQYSDSYDEAFALEIGAINPDSPADEYNSSAPEDRRLEPGMLLIGIDGLFVHQFDARRVLDLLNVKLHRELDHEQVHLAFRHRHHHQDVWNDFETKKQLKSPEGWCIITE
jgi:hypothetical protein